MLKPTNQLFKTSHTYTPKPIRRFDIYLAGENKVGKTSIMSKYFDNKLIKDYQKTDEVDVKIKKIIQLLETRYYDFVSGAMMGAIKKRSRL